MTKSAFSRFVGILILFCSCSGSDTSKKSTDAVEPDSASLHHLLEDAYVRYASPNSSIRNEDSYIHILKYALSQPALAYTDSVRAAEDLRLALKNRPGSIAADFVYALADGTRHRMHEIEAYQLIIAFYDPECPHCWETLRLLDNPDVRRRVAADSLKVLAVYTEGNYQVWRDDVGNMPKDWIVAIDCDSIVARELYNLPAMPIIYLLDSDKRVLLKDPPLQ